MRFGSGAVFSFGLFALVVGCGDDTSGGGEPVGDANPDAGASETGSVDTGARFDTGAQEAGADAGSDAPFVTTLLDASSDARIPDASDASPGEGGPADGGDATIVSDGGDATVSEGGDATLAAEAGADAADSSIDGADAACSASLSTDPLNCGACLHSCLGGACSAGVCQPFLLASEGVANQFGPNSVNVDDTRVYWAEADPTAARVWSVNKDGTDLTLLASQMHGVAGLYVDSNNILWNEVAGTLTSPSRVFKANKDGSNPVELAVDRSSSACCFQGLTADSAWAYFIEIHNQVDRVARNPGDGGLDEAGPPAFSGGQSYLHYLWRLTQDSDNLYVTSTGTEDCQYHDVDGGCLDGGDPGSLVRFPKDGGAPSQLYVGGAPLIVAVDATGVYWTDPQQAAVLALRPGATTPTILTQNRQLYTRWLYGIAVDPPYVYYSVSPDPGNGTIERVPIAGGTSQVLASGQNRPAEVATDATAIYWTNQGDGTVYKLAKPAN